MKLLGIDTTTSFLCIGLYDGEKIYEYNMNVGNKLSGMLMPTVKRIIGMLGWRLVDIDYFICGVGPGSFTGIRTGLAAIKGMSLVLDKPVVGISSLDILAMNANVENQYIIPILDARRNMVYLSIYRKRAGVLRKISPYLLLKEEKFLRKIIPGSVLLGDGLGIYKDRIKLLKKDISFLEKDYWYPRGHNIIKLGLNRIKNDSYTDAFGIKPVYLYPKDCQIKKNSKV